MRWIKIYDLCKKRHFLTRRCDLRHFQYQLVLPLPRGVDTACALSYSRQQLPSAWSSHQPTKRIFFVSFLSHYPTHLILPISNAAQSPSIPSLLPLYLPSYLSLPSPPSPSLIQTSQSPAPRVPSPSRTPAGHSPIRTYPHPFTSTPAPSLPSPRPCHTCPSHPHRRIRPGASHESAGC